MGRGFPPAIKSVVDRQEIRIIGLESALREIRSVFGAEWN